MTRVVGIGGADRTDISKTYKSNSQTRAPTDRRSITAVWARADPDRRSARAPVYQLLLGNDGIRISRRITFRSHARGARQTTPGCATRSTSKIRKSTAASGAPLEAFGDVRAPPALARHLVLRGRRPLTLTVREQKSAPESPPGSAASPPFAFRKKTTNGPPVVPSCLGVCSGAAVGSADKQHPDRLASISEKPQRACRTHQGNLSKSS